MGYTKGIHWNLSLIKKYIEIDSNSKCKLISNEYINNETKIHLQCKCGNDFWTNFANFKNGKRQCNKCGIKLRADKRKLKYDYIRKYIELQNYELISPDYTGNNCKLKIKCNNGHVFEMCFSNFQQGQRCPICLGRQKSINDINNIINVEGYKLLTNLTEIVKNTDKLSIQCPNGHIFYMSYSDFQQGSRCGICNGHFRHKDTEYFKTEVSKLVKDEYSVLGEYTGAKINILIKHNLCNYEYETTPTNFIRGNRCPKCQHRSYKKTTEEFKQEVLNLVGDEYDVLGEYLKNDKLILFKHKKCDKSFKMRPANFLNGNRCPHCNQSKGEVQIENILTLNNNYYLKEFRIKDCKNKRPLPFDFAIFENKEKTNLKLLIEYDGQQHFKKVDFFGGNDAYQYLKKNDNIKNEYCKNNNIKLLRIPYWDFDNIENILIKELLIINS